MVQDYDPSEIPSVYNLKEVPTFRDEPGITQTVFRGIDQMVGLTIVGPEREEGEPHTHPYEQMNMLIEGRVDFLVDGERVTLEPFDILEIPPEVEHTSRAVTDEEAILLAFWPLREDRIDATDYQREFDTE